MLRFEAPPEALVVAAALPLDLAEGAAGDFFIALAAFDGVAACLVVFTC